MSTKSAYCLYTRQGRSVYLEDTNTNRARKFATINGERWTNRGMVIRDDDPIKAEHAPAPGQRAQCEPTNQADRATGHDMLVALQQALPLLIAHANRSGEGVATIQVVRAAIAKATPNPQTV